MAQPWKMLKRVFDLKQEIQTFVDGKGKAIADGEWICEFVFIVDVTTHFN
jgi:hypothetical protein